MDIIFSIPWKTYILIPPIRIKLPKSKIAIKTHRMMMNHVIKIPILKNVTTPIMYDEV